MGDTEERIAKLREQYLYELGDDGYEVDVVRDDFFDYNINIDWLFTNWEVPDKCHFQLLCNNKCVYEIVTGKNCSGLYARCEKKYIKIDNEITFNRSRPDSICRLLRNGLRKRILSKNNNISIMEYGMLDIINSSLWDKTKYNGVIRTRERLNFNIEYFSNAKDAYLYADKYRDSTLHTMAFGCEINNIIDLFVWYNGRYNEALFDINNLNIHSIDNKVIFNY